MQIFFYFFLNMGGPGVAFVVELWQAMMLGEKAPFVHSICEEMLNCAQRIFAMLYETNHWLLTK